MKLYGCLVEVRLGYITNNMYIIAIFKDCTIYRESA